MKKPVSKFAFQVHNLQRYNAGAEAAAAAAAAASLSGGGSAFGAGTPAPGFGAAAAAAPAFGGAAAPAFGAAAAASTAAALSIAASASACPWCVRLPDSEARVLSRRNNASGDVRLWCPRASDLAPPAKEAGGGRGGDADDEATSAKYADALRHFQWHWSRGHPVLVREIPTVGICTLNQVDPSPITYSLSNP